VGKRSWKPNKEDLEGRLEAQLFNQACYKISQNNRGPVAFVGLMLLSNLVSKLLTPFSSESSSTVALKLLRFFPSKLGRTSGTVKPFNF
jgi:hypothetical protein